MAKKKQIPDKMYFRIGEVADIVGVKTYVLRYWESEFPDIKPSKSQSNQRLYKRRDVEALLAIKELLYDKKFTINGARQHLKDMMKGNKEIDLFPSPSSKKAEKKADSAKETKEMLIQMKKGLESCLAKLRK